MKMLFVEIDSLFKYILIFQNNNRLLHIQRYLKFTLPNKTKYFYITNLKLFIEFDRLLDVVFVLNNDFREENTIDLEQIKQ